MRDKRKKFVDLAEARVSRALKDIQLIGNLSNSAAYEYTEADIRKIFSVLHKELDTAKSRFSQTQGGGPEFRL
jgi:hypothetical protein